MADTQRSQPAAAPAAPSRRHVTVLYTDLSDSTQLSGAMEAESYAAMLDELRHWFRAAVESRGGVVNQYQGDGLQAVFGHPMPSEHDGQRAAESALEVHALVRAMRLRYGGEGAGSLSVHSGLHAGQALTRPGDAMAGHVELFGPAPGIAKHLSDSAEPDEILVSDETLGPAAHLFDTGLPRSVLLKGRSEPLVVRRILARSALRTRFEAHSQRGLVPFVGRQRELARLDQLLEEVIKGGLRFGLIEAPAGSGKTRLAEEFLLRSVGRGCTVLRGNCDSELSAEPLQPFLQMLRPSSPGGGETTTAASPDASTLLDEVAAIARQGPLVMFFDDWQWADDATRQLVYSLRAGTTPLLLLATERSPRGSDFDSGSVDRISLAPFDEQEALSTVAELLPSVDPFTAQQIVRQSGGNPLFLEELCHFAGRAGQTASPLPQQGGPAWLETLIAARVSHLPPEQRRVLDAAAVLGNLVPASHLESLTGLAASDPSVTALAEQDLLFPAETPGMWRFKHGITRDVVYAAIGRQARRAAHREAAALLADRDDAAAEAAACEALAYHCSGAGEHARAARCAAMAGDKAMQASSIDRAKAQYRAALELMDQLPQDAGWYQRWRSVARRLGMASVYDATRADLHWLDRAITLARLNDDHSGLAFASYWRAYVGYALGDSCAAIGLCDAAMAAAPAAGDPRLVTQVRGLRGQVLAARGEGTTAATLLDEVTAAMRSAAQRAGDRSTASLPYALACRASALGDLGWFDQAHAVFTQALAALPGPGHEVEASVLCLRSNVSLWQGHWAQAAADATAAQQVGQRVRSLYLLAMSRSLGAWADWQCARQRGDARAARAAIQSLADATAWLNARDKRLFISLNHGRLAEAFLAHGDTRQARHHAALALQRCRACDPLGAPTALRAMAQAAAASGQAPLARRRLALAEKVARARQSAHELQACADCRRALGISA